MNSKSYQATIVTERREASVYRWNSRVLKATLLLGMAGLVGCQREQETPHEVALRPVLTMVAASHNGLTDGYSGIVEPRYQTDLSFRLLGRIVTRDADVGDTVTVGQRLATMDSALLLSSVRSNEASLANSVAQLENAAANFNRQQLLFNRKVTAPADFDLAKKNHETALAAVVQAKTDLAKAQEELSYADLLADIGGVVTAVQAEVGQTVLAGQTIVSIANPDLREAVVDIGEDVVNGLAADAKFRVRLQAGAGIETVGKLREIAPQADAKTRTRRIRIMLDDPPDAFRLGSTIAVFPESLRQPLIRVPHSAILEQEGKSFVWIVDAAKKQVKRVEVTIAQRAASVVAISSGIQLGDRVVTAGVHSLADDQAIRLDAEDVEFNDAETQEVEAQEVGAKNSETKEVEASDAKAGEAE